MRSLDRHSIVTKLRLAIFGNAIVPMLLLALMLGLFAYFAQAGAQHAERVRAEIAVGQAGFDLIRASQVLNDMRLGDADQIGELRAALRDASNELEGALEVGRDRFPDGHIKRLTLFYRDVNDLRQQTEQQSVAEVTANAAKSVRRLNSCATKIAVLFGDMHNYAGKVIEALIANIMTAFAICCALALSAALASYIGARAIIENVVKAIASITRSMNRLSDGDLKIALPGQARQDEIGEMARALEVLRNSSLELQNLITARAQEAECRLAQEQSENEKMRALRSEKSQLLEGLADGFELSVGDLITSVSAATQQLQTTSQQMLDLADGSNEQTDSAKNAMTISASNVTAAAAATDEFALSISEISQQASSSAELARNASDLVTTANTKMNDLSQAAVEVGEIIELIQTIAQRTNLLALNASIEAARGGEAGRGFSVVAREVKELAMQTSEATASVTNKISAMQGFTQSSAHDLSAIVGRISELEQAAVMIATAVDQQSVSASELARHIDTAAGRAVDINAKLGLLSAASNDTGSAASDVAKGAAALSLHAEALRAKANGFVGDVRRSARELEAGGEGFGSELRAAG